MKSSNISLAGIAFIFNALLVLLLTIAYFSRAPWLPIAIDSGQVSLWLILLLGTLLLLLFFVYRRDISTYKIKRTIARKEKNFELAVSNVRDYAIFMIDTNGKVCTWNKGAQNMKGYTADEVIGQPIDIFYTQEDLAKGIPQRNLRLALEKTSLETKGWRLRKDKTAFFADITFIALFDENGDHYGYLKFTRDITEKRKDEERIRFLATIANNIHDPVISTDNNFIITRWNKGAKITFGWKSSEAIGKDIVELLQAEYPVVERQRILYLLQEEGYWNGEVIYHNSIGQPINVWATVSHLVDEDGRVTGNLILARDITGSKKTEDALNKINNELEQRVMEKTMKLYESEKQLRYTMDNMLEGIQILDFGWHYTYLNNSAVLQSKFTREQLINHTLMEMYPGVEETTLFKTLWQCMHERVSRHIDNEFQYPDGTVGFFELSIQPVPEGLFILSIDISERKKAEARLRESQENMEAIFENSSEGFLLTDLDGNIKTFNNIAIERMKFVTGKEMAPGTSIFEFVEEKDVEFFSSVFASVIAGETVQFDQLYKLPDGSESWINFSFNPVRKNDEITGMCVTGRDITQKKLADRQQKEMTERMSAIINTLPANIALLDEKGVIVDVNNAWRNFADENDYIGPQYCIGDNYIDVAKKAKGAEKSDGFNVARGLALIIKKEIKEFIYEYPCHSPAKYRWFRMIATPLEEQRYSGAVVMHIDISEVKRLEEERLNNKIMEQKKLAQAILMAQEEERDHIGKELHDNINQILAGTKLYLGAAAKQNKQLKELNKYPMELIDKSIEEIRILSKRNTTPPKNIGLKENIESLLDSIRKSSNMNITLHYPSVKKDLSPEIKLNIYRMIQEQMTNILKHANANNVTVTIEVGDHEVFCVTEDDGRGFDTKMKRTGIGMSNMQNRLELLSGNMNIISAPGKGCIIKAHIPLNLS